MENFYNKEYMTKRFLSKYSSILKSEEKYRDKTPMEKRSVIVLIEEMQGDDIPEIFIDCYLSAWDTEGFNNLSYEESSMLWDKTSKYYWRWWDLILERAIYTDKNGDKWKLYHEYDLLAIKQN